MPSHGTPNPDKPSHCPGQSEEEYRTEGATSVAALAAAAGRHRGRSSLVAHAGRAVARATGAGPSWLHLLYSCADVRTVKE